MWFTKYIAYAVNLPSKLCLVPEALAHIHLNDMVMHM